MALASGWQAVYPDTQQAWSFTENEIVLEQCNSEADYPILQEYQPSQVD